MNFRRKPRPKLAKKWEGDYTTIKKHYKHIIFPIGGVALAGVTVAAIFLPLYIKSKAEEGLGNFMDEGGTVPAFRKDQPINYVAMGDSITAGYNGFFHGSDDAPKSKDYLSYADFFAQDLKNAGMLGSYKNYAKSGDTIWDTNELVTESQAVNHAIKEADYITISISSNDLLGAATALGLPFGTSLNKLMGNVQLPNHLRDAIHKDTNTGIAGADKNKLIADAMKKAVDVLYNGDVAGALDMRTDYDKIILDVIKRGLMILTRDMHQAAPKAHIQFIMPEFPLLGISKKIENDPTPVTGKSVLEYFQGDFFNAVKAGISAQFTSFTTFDNAFVDYAKNLNANALAAQKMEDKYDADWKNKLIVDYIGARLHGSSGTLPAGFTKWDPPAGIPNNNVKVDSLTDAQLKSLYLSKEVVSKLNLKEGATISDAIAAYDLSFKNLYRDRQNIENYNNQIQEIATRYKGITTDRVRTIITNEFMNDFADIHPSTRGHQVMADYLFKKIMPLISHNAQPVETLYQSAIPFTDDGEIQKFEELDQIDWSINPKTNLPTSTINKNLHLLNPELEKSTVAKISRAINTMITQNPDGTESPLKHVLEIFKQFLNDGPEVSGDVYTISFDPNLSGADQAYKVKGSTPGFDFKGFLATLMKDYKSSEDEIISDDTFWVSIATLLNQELIVGPNAAQNVKDVKADLAKFVATNNFDSNVVSGKAGLISLQEILNSMNIDKSGDYAGSTVIDWTRVSPTNAIRKDLESKPYLKTHIKTLADLFSAADRARLISLVGLFVKQKVAILLDPAKSTKYPDLQTTLERSVEFAERWGLTDLANELKITESLGPAQEELLQAIVDHGTESMFLVRAAFKQGASFQDIINAYQKVTQTDKDAIAVVLKKYNDLKGQAMGLDDGFAKLFETLGI